MSTQPTVELTESERIVLQVAGNKKYAPKKRVRWEMVLLDHPEWREHISYGSGTEKAKKAQYILKSLKQRGITPKNFETLTTTAPTVSTNGTHEGMNSIKDWVLEFSKSKKYTKANGNINFTIALAENPQAKELLLGPDGRVKPYAYTFQTKIHKEGISATSSKKPGRRLKTAQTAVLEVEPTPEELQQQAEAERFKEIEKVVTQRLEFIISQSSCCPRCGKSLENQLRLGLMESKMQMRNA